MSNEHDGSTNFREIARFHLNAAQENLSEGDDEKIRYAALDLRLAIEALSYELLSLYLDDVDEEAMRKWQPRAVIAELSDIDPHVEISWTVSVGEPHEEQELGSEQRITGAWAHKAHNALGNFLHIPTYEQISTDKVTDWEKMRRKCLEVAAEIEGILDSSVSAIRMNIKIGFSCSVCGHRISRQITAMQPGTQIRCRGCDAIYDIKKGGRPELRIASWTCSAEHHNSIPAHNLVVGKKFNCSTCGEPQSAFRVTMIAPAEKAQDLVDVNPPRRETKHLGEFIPPNPEGPSALQQDPGDNAQKSEG